MAPSKKPRCDASSCKEFAQRIVGDCGFCQGHFCGKHRLLEDHKCEGLEDVSIHPVSFETAQWWLVGLDEVLGSGDFETSSRTLANMTPNHSSARRRHTSRTQHS